MTPRDVRKLMERMREPAFRARAVARSIRDKRLDQFIERAEAERGLSRALSRGLWR